jgi:hypothetical protein
MRQAKQVIANRDHSLPQRPSKTVSHRYRIHVIDRAAQIMDCFGFDHVKPSVSDIRTVTA